MSQNRNEVATIARRIGNYADVLRDDGVSSTDYLEQITYLLFLKMADEQEALLNRETSVPKKYNWQTLMVAKKKGGDDLETTYRHILENLSKQANSLGIIYRKAQNKIQDPAKLERMIDMIDSETWMKMDLDIKGAIYEQLLKENAEDTKSGAGQYFTPRPLIRAIVNCIRPKPGQTICDPACGTGGFFQIAHEYLTRNYKLDRDQKRFIREKTFRGWEIVDATARLCVMNMFLHGLDNEEPFITVADALASDPGERFDLVLTNPPFGKKSSFTVVGEKGDVSTEKIIYQREDFWETGSNKQLNFLQHVKTLIKQNGTAVMVIPDNVLFEGGAGEKIRRKLLEQYDVHTLLRLPTGIFYKPGVKANVIFFDRRPAREQPWTDNLWIYDFRTNQHFTLKQKPLKFEDLGEFISCYNPENRRDRKESERFKVYSYGDLIKREKVSLDIFWLQDDSLEDMANLPDPDVIAAEIMENLEAAVAQFSEIIDALHR